jgi:hypothetical protein
MRQLTLLLLTFVVCAGASLYGPDLIISDFNAGAIARYDELLYLVKFIRAQDEVPATYLVYPDDYVIPSYTPYLKYVADHMDELTSAQQQDISNYLYRPGQIGYLQSSQYPLRFHYYQDGQQDYASKGLGYLNYSWHIETDADNPDRLWAPPPDMGMGGSSDYDYYIEAIPPPTLGYTSPEYPYTPTPRYDYTSWIAVDDSLDDANYRATVCHELAHAIQFGADYAESRMLEEGAVYHEDIVYPGAGHDYSIIGDFQGNPQRTLVFSSGLWMYGAWIWYKFLELNYFDEDGYWYDDMYREAIQQTGYNDPSIYETLADQLAAKGTNLADAFHLFGIWRIFTGTYTDGYHWPVPIGTNMAHAWSHSVNDYPVEDFEVPEARLPQKMATNLIWFSTNTNHEMFAISFDGQNEVGTEHRVWQVSVVGVRRDGGEPDVWEMDVDNDYNYGSLVVSDWSPYLKIAMLITQYGDGNLDPDDNDSSMWTRSATYTYSAWITDVGADVADLSGQATDEGVLVTWRAEGDISGYNVYRGTERLNTLTLDTAAVSYLDRDAEGGEYYLGVLDPTGVEVRYGPVTVDPADSGARAMQLEQNFPSPVTGTTTINFTLPEAGPVSLSVYDLSGRLVDTIVDGELEAGPHACVWDASGRSAGVYLYTLTTPDGSLTRRLVVAR